jgi:hypothetical protein
MDINMPQLKQPMRPEEMGIREHCNKYCDKCEKWMQDLLEAMKRDKDTYMVVFDTVMKECREMEEEISKLPPEILKLLSPRLAKKFAKLICIYNCEFRWPPRHSWGALSHVPLCKAVFRSVLTRFIEKFDTSFMTNKLGVALMVENLDFVPGLLELHLYPNKRIQSGILAGMIHHLKNLQIFEFKFYCTDEIIAQLQRHCPHLTNLKVAYSREVTNASVQPLREARKLKRLNLEGTEIDEEHYALLLSELPNIANIMFWRKEASILRHIAVERLDTITHVTGYLQDIDTLTHKCPNTTNINICPVTTDLSGLTAFKALRTLNFYFLDYGSSNFKAVLQGVGHGLTDLKLSSGEGVDLQDITTLCPSLANLCLISCSLSSLNSNTPFDPQLPHFRNLINLEIDHLVGCPNVSRYIRHYVNLKTICLIRTSSFTVLLVKEIINLGTYKQLEILRVEEIWQEDIDVKALELLIQHCPLLKRIALTGGRRSLYRDVFGELKHQILLQNVHLKFRQYERDRSPYKCYANMLP